MVQETTLSYCKRIYLLFRGRLNGLPFFMQTKQGISSYSNMIILQKTLDPQTFSFIAKSKVYSSMYVRDESTNITTEVTIDTNTLGDYVDTISAIFSLEEGRYYTIELKNVLEVVFKGKIFCTNQSVQTYSVNNDTYVSNNTTNDFITYE